MPDLDVLTFNFQSIQLNQLDWRDFLQRRNPVAAALMAKKDRPKVKVECLRLLATLQLDPARTFLISGFVDTYLRLNQSEEQVFQLELEPTVTVNLLHYGSSESWPEWSIHISDPESLRCPGIAIAQNRVTTLSFIKATIGVEAWL